MLVGFIDACHLGGVAQLQSKLRWMDAGTQGFNLRTLKQQLNILLDQRKIAAGKDNHFDQTNIVVAGDNFCASPGSEHTLNARRALFRLVAATQL